MSIAENLTRVKEQIANAAIRSGRSPESVRLVGVTKTVDLERIEEAVSAGLQILGENYVQEARSKTEQFGEEVSWHFVGRLQTNKAKYAVKLFDMIETVDSIKLELNRWGVSSPFSSSSTLPLNRRKAGLSPLSAFLLVTRSPNLSIFKYGGL
jgi:uncharacterized pyridoxal phosphate-containing UPF0001 family protein